jgi:thiosulfate/3-mercaptopyruvate sulfurtransferase
MVNRATRPGDKASQSRRRGLWGCYPRRLCQGALATARNRFQGAYGLAVSSLALFALGSNLSPAYAGNLVTLDSEYLGDGAFEYRLTCNPQPYLMERSGLSNFSLSFPGFDSVVQEPANWQRAPGFPTVPQAEASLQWLRHRTNWENLPYQCAFRVRTQKSSFRLGTSQATNLLHWKDWAEPLGYRTHIQESLTLRCLLPCDPEQSDGSPPLYHDAASDFPEISIPQCDLMAFQALRLGISARTGLPLCVEATADLKSWHRVGFLAASGLTTPWTAHTTDAGALQFYRAVAGEPEFDHPEALASTQWVEQKLGDPSVRIVDSRYPQSDAAFGSGHIPGAVKVDPLTDLRDPNSAPLYLVPTVPQFEALMSRLGVSNSTTVVVYDTVGGLWCGRLWWALRYYGHENVKLLHGGLEKWQLELRPLEQAVVLPPPATFTAQAHPELRASFTEVQAAVGSTNVIILDALSGNHHTGVASDMPGLPAGHIPSSKNFPATANLDANYLLRLPPETLAAIYVNAGVTPDKGVVTYCGGGYYGAFGLFVLYQLGYENVRLYDGSWIEWVSRGGQIETGP